MKTTTIENFKGLPLKENYDPIWVNLLEDLKLPNVSIEDVGLKYNIDDEIIWDALRGNLYFDLVRDVLNLDISDRPSPEYMIDHIDGELLNLTPINLEWVTKDELYSRIVMRYEYPELEIKIDDTTIPLIIRILKLRREGYGMHIISSMMNVEREFVYAILCKHVRPDLYDFVINLDCNYNPIDNVIGYNGDIFFKYIPDHISDIQYYVNLKGGVMYVTKNGTKHTLPILTGMRPSYEFIINERKYNLTPNELINLVNIVYDLK